MSGLTLARLRRIRLPARPVLQRVAACLLVWPNYRFLPGVEVIFEDLPALPSGPVLVAMNHTDRYNYFPFMFRWWREKGRFCSAWMKGKYYENPILGAVMERMGTIPTVSRGYLVVRDFRDVTGRVPDDAEYRHLRTWVEGGAGLTRLESDALRPPPGSVPDAVLTRPRDILGRRFDPSRESYAEAMNGLYSLMMERFVALHEESLAAGRDLLVFPQGTRSVRLTRGRPGIGQVALHYRLPILPVGCNGSDRLYPGTLPWARHGRVTYRFGRLIGPQELVSFAVPEPFRPFTPETEKRWNGHFQGVADLVMGRIDALLDPEYRFGPGTGETSEKGAHRFV